MIVAIEVRQICRCNFPARASGAILVDYVEKNDAVVDARFFLGHNVCFSFTARWARLLADVEGDVCVWPGFVLILGESRGFFYRRS